ncbi:helix-turn-helix domain-containing protein [Nocardia otitidiscaviarum]|uniref:helix-turn-helix domain-containing protein n=1 Tax=Nocardia otitidiscaviarum TaxID=1823 RepID=UPI00351A05FE
MQDAAHYEKRIISGTAVLVYAALLRHADWESWEAWPSRRTLANEVGVKQAKSIDSYIQELVNAGFLEKIPQFESGNGTWSTARDDTHVEQCSNRYRLLANLDLSANSPSRKRGEGSPAKRMGAVSRKERGVVQQKGQGVVLQGGHKQESFKQYPSQRDSRNETRATARPSSARPTLTPSPSEPQPWHPDEYEGQGMRSIPGTWESDIPHGSLGPFPHSSHVPERTRETNDWSEPPF